MAARLERVAERQALAPVLEAGAVKEASELTGLLRNDLTDVHTRFLLGWFYWYRYLALPEGQGLRDLDSAVSLFTPCMVSPIPLRDLPESLLPILAEQVAPVANLMHRQALSSADPRALSAAVNIWRRLLAATPDNHVNRSGLLLGLGVALQTRFTRMGELADLDEAIRAGREGVASTPDGHPNRGNILTNLASLLQASFGRTGDLADLDEAIANYQEAVAVIARDDSDRAPLWLSSVPRCRADPSGRVRWPTWTRRSRRTGTRWRPPLTATLREPRC